MERKLVTVAVDGSAEFTTLTPLLPRRTPPSRLHFVLGSGPIMNARFLELADYIIDRCRDGADCDLRRGRRARPLARRGAHRYLSQPVRFALAAAAPGWST